MITIWVPKRLVEVGLYNVAARSPQELAALSEQSYRDRVKYAAEKVRLSGTKIVMLTGPSASGKTTSAHKLAEARSGREHTPMWSAWIIFSVGRSSTPACPTDPGLRKPRYDGSAPCPAVPA